MPRQLSGLSSGRIAGDGVAGTDGENTNMSPIVVSAIADLPASAGSANLQEQDRSAE